MTAHDDIQQKEQAEAWKKEQLSIASQVVVLQDPPQDGCEMVSKNNEDDRFMVLKQLHQTTKPTFPTQYYGGVDVSFPEDDNDLAVAAYVILETATRRVVYEDYELFELTVPYIPSFLAFREVDPLVRLVEKQRAQKPDLTPRAILVDGNGVLHPRRAGLACGLGVRIDIPTVGVGKTLFCQGGLTKEGVLEGIGASLAELVSQLRGETLVSSSLGELGSRLKRQNESATKDEHCGTQRNRRGSSNRPAFLVIDREGIDGEADVGVTLDPNGPDTSTTPTEINGGRGNLVQEIAPYCHGVAIPLKARHDFGENNDPYGKQQLAFALVGHGKHATKNPIYISVGHKISLIDAVSLCAMLSWEARIPEPVRQADLRGRELLRKQGKNNKPN